MARCAPSLPKTVTVSRCTSTQMAPVIYIENIKPEVKMMRWGLVPADAKDSSIGGARINARYETLTTRGAFCEAFKKRRCLVPADSFFEWQEREGKRQPFREMLKRRRTILLRRPVGAMDQAPVGRSGRNRLGRSPAKPSGRVVHDHHNSRQQNNCPTS